MTTTGIGLSEILGLLISALTAFPLLNVATAMSAVTSGMLVSIGLIFALIGMAVGLFIDSEGFRKFFLLVAILCFAVHLIVRFLIIF